MIGGNSMGTVQNRKSTKSEVSSYSGKGTTSVSTPEKTTKKPSKTLEKTPMQTMFELLEEVEERRAAVEQAQKELEKAEKKVSEQLEKLDPELREKLRGLLGGPEKPSGRSGKKGDSRG